MKNLKQIKDEYAQGVPSSNESEIDYFVSWTDLYNGTPPYDMERHYDEIARRYAIEVAKASLEEAADNVSELDGIRDEVYDKITNEENIVLLKT